MVNDAQLSRLKSLATSFHAVMAGHDFSDSGLNLQCFPSECCHQACKLLSMFLFDHGLVVGELQGIELLFQAVGQPPRFRLPAVADLAGF